MVLAALIAFSLGIDAGGSAPYDAPCTEADGMAADDLRFHSWDDLYIGYQKYGQCDDPHGSQLYFASVAESYSDAVGLLLSEHWSDAAMARLLKLTSRDAGFERFILRHVDATIEIDRARMAKTNVSTKCPKAAARLCKQILAALLSTYDFDAGALREGAVMQ